MMCTQWLVSGYYSELANPRRDSHALLVSFSSGDS